jgi:exonuclease III
MKKLSLTLLLFLLSLNSFSKEYKILSYNIQDLPGITGMGGEDFQFEYIGKKLAEMRDKGEAPDIVMIQEAFSYNSIDIIQRYAGYKYIFYGPHRFGFKPIGSGLYVLTDLELEFDINIAFPSLLCADHDCMAAKGYQILKFKDSNTYVINTHLQASYDNEAPGVHTENVDARFGQLALIKNWIENELPKDAKIILGGDINVRPSVAYEYEKVQELGLKNSALMCIKQEQCLLKNDSSEKDVFYDSIDMILLSSNIKAQMISVEKNFKTPIPGTNTIPSDHDGYFIKFEAELE